MAGNGVPTVIVPAGNLVDPGFAARAQEANKLSKALVQVLRYEIPVPYDWIADDVALSYVHRASTDADIYAMAMQADSRLPAHKQYFEHAVDADGGPLIKARAKERRARR